MLVDWGDVPTWVAAGGTFVGFIVGSGVTYLVGAKGNRTAEASLRLQEQVSLGAVSWKVSGNGHQWLVTNTGTASAMSVEAQAFDVYPSSTEFTKHVQDEVTPGSAFHMYGSLTMSHRRPRVVVSRKEGETVKCWEHPLRKSG